MAYPCDIGEQLHPLGKGLPHISQAIQQRISSQTAAAIHLSGVALVYRVRGTLATC
ncbi:TPA: hypothetical protein ACJIWR_002002 [Enterobacter bugandensis]|uniref:hypothetical protein n=1 Tax=Enterobacter bugandensis TaxID=881260 RepID=UPI0020048C9D|nr:hypothetical protein [Enterobacter bugandensis]MCK6878733.1 hypothetical protein [Enterobacter bugandensis]MCK7411184.1 hypothetical protein [Enterobacter bugandensis]MDH0088311.1 hypothetical protein [Enterobacter bugandensis]MDH0110983.1 hypothetical protein [Enterobacter bugandensis]MDH0131454.1 hypothetical protein [Enterobacter bugandensis]